MAKMKKIIIDIDEELYDRIKTYQGLDNAYFAIKHGTPLPEGHGKIVDIGKIDEDRIDDDNPIIYLTINGEYIEAVSLDYLNNLQAIIEADTESEKA